MLCGRMGVWACGRVFSPIPPCAHTSIEHSTLQTYARPGKGEIENGKEKAEGDKQRLMPRGPFFYFPFSIFFFSSLMTGYRYFFRL